MFGHASATIIPALLAAGEEFGANGKEVLLAHVVGFEAGARIGKGVNLYHYEKGWHPSSTLGVFGVAAACARLLQLSVTETETALALSTSLASGIKANFGTMTKPLHVGQCARNGLMAALLARKGFTANPDALEHSQGFLNVFNGPGHYDVGQIVDGWGAPFDIVAPGACYKQYPCCASTHAAVDAALRLVERHGPFEGHKVKRVDSWTAATRLAHTNRPHPDSSLDAKFSVQYCIARALLHGKVVLDHFEGDAYRESAVCELLPRIHAMACSDGQFPPGNLLGAEVKVTLYDGSALSAKLDRPIGRTSANPITAAQMMSKFESCASRVILPESVGRLYRLIESFEEVASVREFTTLLESATSRSDDRKRTREHDSV